MKKLEKMSIAIKTILHRGPNEETLPRKEIRRFEIEENVNGRYVSPDSGRPADDLDRAGICLRSRFWSAEPRADDSQGHFLTFLLCCFVRSDIFII